MIQELHAGDRQIPASGWNEMRAAVQGMTSPQQQYTSTQRNPVYITICNKTGVTLPAFSAVRLDGRLTNRKYGAEAITEALKSGVELNAYTVQSATDTIAITQAACPIDGYAKAMISGATPVMLTNSSIDIFGYAAISPGNTYLEASTTPTNIRLLYCPSATSGAEIAFALLDNTDDRQYFKISLSRNAASQVIKKGSVIPIAYVNGEWTAEGTIGAATPYRLAVCQEDMPVGQTGTMRMPYYTPEDNYGAHPLRDFGITSTIRHVGYDNSACQMSTSAAKLDYTFYKGRYAYTPKFVYRGAAKLKAANTVGIEIEGQTIQVYFPSASSTTNYPLTAYPDIYTGDEITVLVDAASHSDMRAYAIEYPTDFAKGSAIVVEPAMVLGRGWDREAVQGTPFDYAIKVQGNAII